MTAIPTAPQTGIQKYLDSALSALDRLGIKQERDEESQLAGLLQSAVQVDEPRVMAIARVVQFQGTFNALVRDNIEAMDVHTDYRKIAADFDSIRDDSRTLVEQLADGKIDWREAMANSWMKLTRGTTHDRFEQINKTYKGVGKRTKDQLDREDAIIGAYQDFRFAMKDAEINAQEVLKVQTGIRDAKRGAFAATVTAIDAYKGKDNAERSRLQLTRDEAQRAFEEEDRRYQLIKDVADNLGLGYNAGETLVMKLKQTHDLKDRVYTQAVTFFTTNEHIFTTMDAVYKAQHGLHEQTETLEAMKTGVNKGLEDIASLGNELERAALKAGYGATINATSVQKLVDSIATFQEQSYASIDQYRKEATQNVQEVARMVDEGKRRTSDALAKYVTRAA